MHHQRVCVLGGGQLGRMLAEAANRLLIPLSILDASPHAPAKQLLAHQPHVDAHFSSYQDILALAHRHHPCIMTAEIEHVDTRALEEIESTFADVRVQPPSRVIRVIQDKYRQKEMLRFHGLAVVDYCVCDGEESLLAAADEFGYPFVLKTRKLAYDGRGNVVVHAPEQLFTAFEKLAGHAVQDKVNDTIYAERFAVFTKELAVMVVRSVDGTVVTYPVVETVQRNNVCHVVLAPANVDTSVAKEATRVARAAIDALDGAGVYGVEMFYMADGSVVINEIAPRPHNTGHYTIEACATSQFENHLRAISGLPLGDVDLQVPAAVMVNLLGSHVFGQVCQSFLGVKGATMHLYGKEERAGRKLGHVTVVGSSVHDILTKIQPTLDMLAEDDAETLAVHAQLVKQYAPRPLVGIVMGSDSDLPVMRGAAHMLEHFKVPFELTIVSAHRTPARLTEYAQTAQERGLRIIIAGAGGAAHLPGMLACQTPLPIIGVPVKGKVLDGVDSLHSIVQMPRGIPVATVAINGAENAGLLAVRMLGVADPTRLAQMSRYMAEMEQQVMDKVDTLARVGWKDYP